MLMHNKAYFFKAFYTKKEVQETPVKVLGIVKEIRRQI